MVMISYHRNEQTEEATQIMTGMQSPLPHTHDKQMLVSTDTCSGFTISSPN